MGIWSWLVYTGNYSQSMDHDDLQYVQGGVNNRQKESSTNHHWSDLSPSLMIKLCTRSALSPRKKYNINYTIYIPSVDGTSFWQPKEINHQPIIFFQSIPAICYLFIDDYGKIRKIPMDDGEIPW